MGNCIYCGRPAGILRSSHKECQELLAKGKQQISLVMTDTALSPSETVFQIKSMARRHHVGEEHLHAALAEGWTACVRAQLKVNGLNRSEEKRLNSILDQFDKKISDIDRNSLWERVLDRRKTAAQNRIGELVQEAIADRSIPNAYLVQKPARSLSIIEDDINKVAKGTGVYAHELRNILVRSIEVEVDRALEDGLLSANEESAIATFAAHFGLDSNALDRQGAWTRVTKAAILRDLTEGIVPQRMDASRVDLPFRLQKSETLIWLFTDVDYSTVRTRREFQGGHAGVSIRVAKGLYFHTGGFKGRPVQVEETVYVDTGLLGITTRHIYFSGSAKSFRVRHDRIVAIQPYSDGVGITRDGVRAKPETFQLGDGWFAYNLLRNIEVP